MDEPLGWVSHFPEHAGMRRNRSGVAVDGRLVSAAEHIITGGGFVITWLASDPLEPGALEELLESLGADARRQGCRLDATTRNELGVGWFGTPLAWDHVVRGFREAGLVPGDRWRIMTADAGSVPRPGSAPFRTMTVERREDAAAGERSLWARVGDVAAADAVSWEISGLPRGCPGTEGWTTIEAIDVEEPFRRHGVGRYLLAEQAAWLAAAGFARLLLFTETSNEPAIRLFESMGFSAGPECWCMHAR